MAKKTTLQEFESVFYKLEEALMEHAKTYNLPEMELKWYQRGLRNNCLGGKCHRGMSVPDSASILLDRPLTEQEYFQTATLGWMAELLQAFFLVTDDIMDGSITRRGKPCWYRQEGVGLVAINGASMLESSIYILLKKFFRTHLDIMELLQEASWRTEIGQLCDTLTAPENTSLQHDSSDSIARSNVTSKRNFGNFTMERYRLTVVHKTAYYSFYFPIALALFYLDIATASNLQVIEATFIPIGELFQIQDDYLDNFGDPTYLGKIGTDIVDNKCSWLIIQALARATPKERMVLEENYGQKDIYKERIIKKIYDDLRLKDQYEIFEEIRCGEILEMIAEVDESQGFKRSVLSAILEKIYKRRK